VNEPAGVNISKTPSRASITGIAFRDQAAALGASGPVGRLRTLPVLDAS